MVADLNLHAQGRRWSFVFYRPELSLLWCDEDAKEVSIGLLLIVVLEWKLWFGKELFSDICSS